MKKLLKNSDNKPKGFGIPGIGGMIFHPDWSIEAVSRSLSEFIKNENGDIIQSIIKLPMEEDDSFDETLVEGFDMKTKCLPNEN